MKIKHAQKKPDHLLMICSLGLCCWLYSMALHAQGWEKLYGGVEAEAGYAVVETFDGGFVVAGWTESFGASGQDLYLFKTDSAGQELWSRTFGGPGDDRAYGLVETADSGFALIGHTDKGGSQGKDIWLLRVNQSGDSLWSEHYGSAGDDHGYDLALDTDEGFVLTGFSSGMGGDLVIIKTDPNGNAVWTKTYGGAGLDIGNSVRVVGQQGYIIAGMTTSFGSGDPDLYLVRVDVSGDSLWTRAIGGLGQEYGQSLVVTADSGFAIAGYINNYDIQKNDVYLVRTDSLGNLQWHYSYGGTGEDQGYGLVAVSTGGFAISGYTTSYGNEAGDMLLLTTDPNGIEEWTRTYGGSIGDKGLSIAPTRDKGYIMAGYKWGFHTYDCYLVKTDSAGTTCSAQACILPGDANQDGVANHIDLLNIGLAYQTTGASRPDSTLIWIPQKAPDWTDTLPGGLNIKHIDCDGNGIIDAADTSAILLNYGRNFSYKTGPRDCHGTMTPLYFELSADSVNYGDTLDVKIHLGDQQLTAQDIYGLALSMNFDPLLVDSTLRDITPDAGWFGNSANRLHLSQQHSDAGQADLALTKTDQLTETGYGEIARFHIVIIDDLEGKRTDTKQLKLSFEDVLVIDVQNKEIPVCLLADSVVVHKGTGVETPEPPDSWGFKAYPNPAGNMIHISGPSDKIRMIRVIDAYGKVLISRITNNDQPISIQSLPAGIYLLEVATDQGKQVLKFIRTL